MFEFYSSYFIRKKLRVVVFLRVIINLRKTIEKLLKTLEIQPGRRLKSHQQSWTSSQALEELATTLEFVSRDISCLFLLATLRLPRSLLLSGRRSKII